jgi:hypothetical protein
MPTFDLMAAKRVELMTIRPPKKNTLIPDLMKLAEKDGNRSLNNYVVMVLQQHVEVQKTEKQKNV